VIEDQDIPIIEHKTPVALRKISLRNWKLFERAEVNLPAVDGEKPIVLLGGANGYGKSSLLEAIVFGLFGRRVTADLDHFLRLGGNDRTRKPTYRSALESAFTRTERARREGFASIELAFDCEGDGLVLQRKWYFDEEGGLIERDEELILWVGDDRDLLEIPAGMEATNWYQTEIERRVVSAGLAPFFLLDGEQVDRLADSKLADQLRFGIERILGLDAMSALAADLLDYARDRVRDLKGSSERDEALRSDADRLRMATESAAERLATIDAQMAPLKAERDQLVDLLAVPIGDSHAELQTLLEAERRARTDCDRLRAAIIDATAFEIPLAMIGKGLQTKLAASLEEDGLAHGSGAIGPDEDLTLLLSRLEDHLSTEAADAMSQLVRTAWAGGVEAAAGAALHHPYLDRSQHREVLAASDAISRGRDHVRDLLKQLGAREGELLELAANIQRRRQQDARRAEAREALSQVSTRLDAIMVEQRQASQELEVRQAEQMPVFVMLEEALSSSRDAAPRIKRAERARDLATLADRFVKHAAPRHFERFAEVVTEAYRALAHKSDVAKIDIAPDGKVVILDGAGRDISDLRRSAGESQLFAMALITAVSAIAGPSLPLIVDTPFGRLDTQHRALALQAFAARPGQTILLVQPEEFGAKQHEQIGDRIAGAFEISYRHGSEGSIGTSILRPEVLAA
jgi:DNA sulfur modification protein DndD